MKTKMLNLRWPLLVRTGALLLLLSVLRLGLTTARADAVSELASFSIFDKIDLGQLAKSDVKTAHGPPMSNPRFLAVQSCYVVAGAPAQQIEALRRWDATRHRELKVFLHSDLPSNPGPANFEKLRNAPSNASVRSFVTATQKLSSNLQISKDEAKKFSAGTAGDGGPIPAPVSTFWTDVLSGRTKSFVSGGMSAQPPYDHAGPSVRASDEVNGLKLSSSGCSLLCQRWLLRCSYIVSDVAGYSGRQTFNPGLARRHDLRCVARLATWRGASWVGVCDDEKHRQSRHALSAGYGWRSLSGETLEVSNLRGRLGSLVVVVCDANFRRGKRG